MTAMSELMEIAIRRVSGGDLPGAEKACLQLLQAQPWHVQALQILGVICGRLGRHEEAITYLGRAIRIDPSNSDLYSNLGVAFARAGRLEEAMAQFRQTLRRRPDHPVALVNLGAALASRGCFAEAIDHYRQLLQVNPGCAATHNNLGHALRKEGQLQEADEHFCEAVRLQPDYATAYSNRAGLLLQLGRWEETINCCHESLRLEPDRVMAYIYLAQLAAEGLYQFTGEQVRHMESLVTAHDSGRVLDGGRRLSNDDASGFHFIVAGLCDRKGEYDRAFCHYRRANELKAQVFRQENRPFNRERHRRNIHDIIATFDRGFFERVRSFGLATEVPVFVVGMPRTGSTLVEQILSSHPQVVAAGERKELGEILTSRAPYPAHMSRLDSFTSRGLAEEYLRRLSRLGPEAVRIIDKTPDNYLHLGSICALFPKARIIHCRRDVMDVCLSCYFRYFSDVNYSTSLEDLGFYYRQYERLMRHWREVLPIPVYEVEYEELVRDPERISRGLIAFCGLDWSECCLAFHENRRPVQTASLVQVRRPLYASSIARWKRYESHLSSLRQALASDPSEAAASTAAFT
ncbi:MAG TPA: sulfotransferase [Gemmataceae bacterium]|nr:sulfotransferase [Gemmataceae bacterium]